MLQSTFMTPPLPAADTQTLVVRMQTGDQAARARLIRANLRLVVHLAKQLRNLGVDIEDLVQEGSIGLVEAVDSYDPARAQLSTYAACRIRSRMLWAVLTQGRAGRVARSARDQALFWAIVRGADDGTLAEQGVPLAEVEALRQRLRPMSLDAPAEPGGRSLLDRLSGEETPDEAVEAKERLGAVRWVLETTPLSPRERLILEARLTDAPIAQRDLAAALGVRRQRIHQIEGELLARIGSRLAQRLGEPVAAAAGRLASARAKPRDLPLSPGMRQVLARLPGPGDTGATAADLAAALHLGTSRCCDLLARLERRGLAVRSGACRLYLWRRS